jgi:hypothetical protein
MLVLYTEYNGMVNAHFLSSEEECYALIQNNKILHYKIKLLNQQFNVNFLSCLVWNQAKRDFEINVNSLIEFKKNYFRQIRPLYFDKLDKILMKVLGNEIKTNEILILKQALRDVTDIEFPKNVSEIELFIPEIFKQINLISI